MSSEERTAGKDWGEGQLSYWRESELLRCDDGASLPDACVLCGQGAAGGAIRARLPQAPDGVALTAARMLGVFGAMAMSEEGASVWVRLCESHRGRRDRNRALAATFVLTGLGLLAWGIVAAGLPTAVPGAVLLILGGIVAMPPSGWPALIERKGAYLSLRVSPRFLTQVPTTRTLHPRRR